MMIKGQNAKNIHPGNSFSEDGLPDEEFDYLLSNPPFGVEWKKVEAEVKAEASTLGYRGRFGAGLPRISDGSLMFVQHMVSKFNTRDNSMGDSSRMAVVLNGSPLFTGSAGSGESEIRRWIIENDWLEAIIALPTDMFYNTGIATYIWIVTNEKTAKRKGKVQLINAVDFHTPMRKSLGSKRKQISEQQINDITQLFGENKDSEYCKLFDNRDFGYQRITVERPLKLNFQVSDELIENLQTARPFAKLKDEQQAAIIAAIKTLDAQHIYKSRDVFIKALKVVFKSADLDIKAPLLKTIWQALSEKDESAETCLIQSGTNKGKPESDTDLRDYENVPLKEDIDAYFKREVLPHVPDAWIDYDKTKIGYEIPFNRYFYKYIPPRSLEEIDTDLDKVSAEIMQMLQEVHV